jgi:hypothetical protein
MPAEKKSEKKESGSGKKYGSLAGKKVEKAMHEMKHGELKSGGSGKKVTNPKQAVAIGLSEAREAGGKVPKTASSKSSGSKSSSSKSSSSGKSSKSKKD